MWLGLAHNPLSMYSNTKFCPLCGAVDAVMRWGKSRQKRARYRCNACQKTFCNRTCTPRFRSHLSEKEWKLIPRLFALRTHPSGSDLGRLLGKSLRTGQRIMRRTRQLLPSAQGAPLKGLAELDETTFRGVWIGGGKSRQDKQVWLTPLTQGRGVIQMNRFVEAAVAPDALVFTDEWGGYRDVHARRTHYTVCHSREFVSAFCRTVHTNGIEGVWGHAKPLAQHTYRGYPHLPDFLKEVCFRFNFSYSDRQKYLVATFFRQSTNTCCT